MWDYVSRVMKDPEQLRADLDRMIELERKSVRCDPDREAEVWLAKLTEADGMRRGYQKLVAGEPGPENRSPGEALHNAREFHSTVIGAGGEAAGAA